MKTKKTKTEKVSIELIYQVIELVEVEVPIGMTDDEILNSDLFQDALANAEEWDRTLQTETVLRD